MGLEQLPNCEDNPNDYIMVTDTPEHELVVHGWMMCQTCRAHGTWTADMTDWPEAQRKIFRDLMSRTINN